MSDPYTRLMKLRGAEIEYLLDAGWLLEGPDMWTAPEKERAMSIHHTKQVSSRQAVNLQMMWDRIAVRASTGVIMDDQLFISGRKVREE